MVSYRAIWVYDNHLISSVFPTQNSVLTLIDPKQNYAFGTGKNRFTVRPITVDVVGNGMSQRDVDTGDGSDDRSIERVLRQDAFARDLNAQGYTDVLMLRRENGRDVLTESRLTLIDYLERHGDDVESVRDLARRLDRDKGAVSKDLRRLAELDVIEYEGSGNGEAKRPVLKHDHIVIEPVIY